MIVETRLRPRFEIPTDKTSSYLTAPNVDHQEMRQDAAQRRGAKAWKFKWHIPLDALNLLCTEFNISLRRCRMRCNSEGVLTVLLTFFN